MKKFLAISGWVVAAFVLGFGSGTMLADTPQMKTSLPRDVHNNAVQVAQTLVFADNSGTASPVTVTAAAVAFTVPPNAVMFTFRGAADLRYGISSTLDGSSGHGYKRGSATTDTRFPCAGLTTVYVRSESGSQSVDFFFEVLK